MNARTVGRGENTEGQEGVWVLRALRWAAATVAPAIWAGACWRSVCCWRCCPRMLLWENRWLRVPSLIERTLHRRAAGGDAGLAGGRLARAFFRLARKWIRIAVQGVMR
jgi:hypothetical protein